MRTLERNYLDRLFSLIPIGLTRKLISMGFPMAGMEYEVGKKEVKFGNSITITFDGKTMLFGRPVNEKVFTAFSLLASVYGEEFAESMYRRGYFDRFRIVRSGGFKSGWYIYFPEGDERALPTKRVLGIDIVDGTPQKRLRGVMYIDHPATAQRAYVYRNGKVQVRYVVDSWSGSNEVVIMYDRIVVERFERTIVYDEEREIIDELKSIYEGIEKRVYDGMYCMNIGWRNVYAGKNFMIMRIAEMSRNGVREFVASMKEKFPDFFANGWKYLYLENIGSILSTPVTYEGFVKRIGSTTVYFQPANSMLGLEFKNRRVSPPIKFEGVPDNEGIYLTLRSLLFL